MQVCNESSQAAEGRGDGVELDLLERRFQVCVGNVKHIVGSEHAKGVWVSIALCFDGEVYLPELSQKVIDFDEPCRVSKSASA